MKNKAERTTERLLEFQALASEAGYSVRSFTWKHWSVEGARRVDYWPGSGKAWVFGSQSKAEPVTPARVIALAAQPAKHRRPNLPEGAERHLRSMGVTGCNKV